MHYSSGARCSDEEIVLQIQENPYLQCICGYPGYGDEKLPFDTSLMVYFRKRVTVLGEINEMIVRDAKERQKKPNSKTTMIQAIIRGSAATAAL